MAEKKSGRFPWGKKTDHTYINPLFEVEDILRQKGIWLDWFGGQELLGGFLGRRYFDIGRADPDEFKFRVTIACKSTDEIMALLSTIDTFQEE